MENKAKFEKDLNKLQKGAVHTFEHKGLKCAIARHELFGTLSGYVENPKNTKDIGLFDVHGGVTYDDYPYWERSNNTYVGFDTAHSFDFNPAFDNPNDNSKVYRDFDYVLKETKHLADQIHETLS